MGALMVVDPQHTARYQPAGLYINRGAPKKQRLVGGRDGKNQKEKKHKETRGTLRFISRTPIPEISFPSPILT
jgi:hypothetical protein